VAIDIACDFGGGGAGPRRANVRKRQRSVSPPLITNCYQLRQAISIN
jgi:hypothetical protein